MATILEFRASTDSPPKSSARRKRRTAEIVIFPGVRYERAGKDGVADRPLAIERDILRLVD